MFQDKYVFAQLASFLNRSKFNRIVAKYDGDDAASQADHAADDAEKITYDRNDAEHQ